MLNNGRFTAAARSLEFLRQDIAGKEFHVSPFAEKVLLFMIYLSWRHDSDDQQRWT